MMPVSVLVLTFNEDKNIANCLRSIVNWSDDVVVLDSFSTDHTRDIVLSHPGVRFLERAFDGYAKQRNYALQEIEYKHPWLLMIDADEQLTPELAKEITEAMSSVDSGTALFRMRRKDYFMGKWLRHSSGYPTWFGRLMRIGSVWIDREINEEYHTSDKIVELDGHLLHYPFNKGIKDWIEKHN
ncbi:MAG: glycosyltransferase family 2 protein, partial [Gammaproteobacteria bacterium]|nr:glycosyltransferase family 2 protein [Gammaproteobacteria bacterium]